MPYMNERIHTDTAILIPCLNEEATITETCRRFKAVLPDAMICVGDNNSTDGTAEAAMAEPACDAVIRCPDPGKGAATKAMSRLVHADWYLTVDGDMTYDASVAPEMLRRAQARDCVVTGARILSKDNQPLLHQPGNALVDRLVGLKYGTEIRDVMSGYRAIPGQVFRDFLNVTRYSGFEIETALAMYVLSRGIPVAYIPCKYDDRPAGSKSKLHTFRDGFRILKAIASRGF